MYKRITSGKWLAAMCGLMMLAAACSSHEASQKITGTWQAAGWEVDGRAVQREIADVGFRFDSSGNYSYRYGTHEEKGTYKVENDMLFTTPAGEREMMVKITKITTDSLVFLMNRGGESEILYLVRSAQK